MVQMGGWGKRSPFSKTEEISLAGIPSYGLDPNVISSQTVTPAGKRRPWERLCWEPGCLAWAQRGGEHRGLSWRHCIARAPPRISIFCHDFKERQINKTGWNYPAFLYFFFSFLLLLFFFFKSQLASQYWTSHKLPSPRERKCRLPPPDSNPASGFKNGSCLFVWKQSLWRRARTVFKRCVNQLPQCHLLTYRVLLWCSCFDCLVA